MRSRTRNSVVVLVASVAVLFCAAANAEPISFTTFNTDAGSGISTSKVYTHKIDMGFTNNAATINQVTFDAISASGSVDKVITATNFQYECSVDVSPYLNSLSGGFMPTGITSGMGIYDLLNDHIYAHGKHAFTKLTFTGLAANTEYDLRLYYRPWTENSTRNVTFNFDIGDDGTVDYVYTVNEDVGSSAQYMSYVYETGSTGTLTVLMNNESPNYPSWHMYGLTNELVSEIPEPGTLALLSCGLIGLLAYAWRKRK